MFGIGSTELLLIMVVALLVLGPRNLAGFAKSLGRMLGEFRRVSTEFQRSLNVETARAEARDAESKRKQPDPEKVNSPANFDANPSPAAEQGVKVECKEDNFGGIPADSPVARELARARAEAQAAQKAVANAEKDLKMEGEGQARTGGGKSN